MYLDFVKKFLKYFNITSSQFGRCDLPYDTTPEELSNVATRLTKEIRYYNNVIYKEAFKSEAADALQTIIKQAAAAYKSQVEDLLVTNIYRLSSVQTDNLLQSFGFPKTALPLYVKKQILKNLVEAYKHKGTLKSTDLIKSIAPGYNIFELFYVNDDPSFQVRTSYLTSANDRILVGITFPYESAESDKFWNLTYEDAQQWPYRYAMSPFYAGLNIIDVYANLEAIIKLRRFAYDDLQVWLNNPDQYDNRKVLHIEPFPSLVSYLELYLLFQYVTLKMKGKSYIATTTLSYMYQGDISNIESDYDSYFKQKQTTSEQGKFNIEVNDIRLKDVWSILNPDDNTRFDLFQVHLGQLDDEVSFRNENFLLVYGRDINDNKFKLKIIDKQDPRKVVSIDIPISIIKPAIFYFKHRVILYGGYNLDGTRSFKRYVINLNSNKISEYDIDQTNWLADPKQVRVENRVFVLSRAGSCRGSIFQFTLDGIPEKLIVQLDDQVLDLDRVKFIQYDSNKLFILAWNTITKTFKALIIDESLEHIIVDVSCLVYTQLSHRNVSKLYKCLKDENLFALSYGRNIYFYCDNTIVSISLDYRYGDYRDYLMPKSISRLLVPTYVNNTKLRKYKLPTTIFRDRNGIIDLNITDTQYWLNWPFTKFCGSCPILPKHNILIQLAEEKAKEALGIDDPLLQQYPNMAFCDLYYDKSNYKYDNLIINFPNDDIILPTCKNIYDWDLDYDRYDQFDIELDCFLPEVDDEKFIEYYPKTENSLYYKTRLPETIRISLYAKDICSYFADFKQIIDTGSLENPSSFILSKKENNELVLTYVIPTIHRSNYETDLNVTYDCQEQDSPLCFVLKKLTGRKELFTKDSNDLHVADNIDELHDFLTQLNRDNMTYLDNTDDLSQVEYNLAYTISKLAPGANFVYMIPDVVQVVKDLVLPIQSRPLFEGDMIVIDDPIADYVHLTDDINHQLIKQLNDFVNLEDSWQLYIYNKFTDNVELDDSTFGFLDLRVCKYDDGHKFDEYLNYSTLFEYCQENEI